MVGGSSHFVSGSSPAVLMVLFEAQYDTPDEIIKKHSEATEKEFKIKLTDEEEKLPQMYWIPKLHKKPYKARFIAGSSSCTTTRLSKLITSCLKLVKSHCISYCKTIYDRTGGGVNAMWIIKKLITCYPGESNFKLRL